jgi:small subunit ribosomal protein S6
VLEELNSSFRFNDAVIRNLVISRNEAVTEPSPLAKKPDEKRERDARDEKAGDSGKASGDESDTRSAAS